MQLQLSLILILPVLFTMAYIISLRQGLKRDYFEKRKAALVLGQEILELVNQMQKHRGMSSGILGGNNDFKVPLRKLVVTIDKRLASIIQESKSYPQLFDNDMWEDIKLRWENKCRNWKHYELVNNIGNHNILIKIILEQVNTLIDRAGLTTSEDLKVNIIARKILRELPELVEHIGQMRAISVHSASAHTCSTDSKLYLRYLHQRIKEDTSNAEISIEVPDQLEAQVKQLLNLVEMEILETEKITVDADVLFQLCTQVIDAYLDITRAAISELKNSIFKQKKI